MIETAALIVVSVMLIIVSACLVVARLATSKLASMLVRAQAILQNCTVECGYCCCGDDMKSHDNGMFSGHAPLDQGTYAAERWPTDVAEIFWEEGPLPHMGELN